MIKYKIRGSDWLKFPLIIVNFNHFFIQPAPGCLDFSLDILANQRTRALIKHAFNYFDLLDLIPCACSRRKARPYQGIAITFYWRNIGIFEPPSRLNEYINNYCIMWIYESLVVKSPKTLCQHGCNVFCIIKRYSRVEHA